MKHSRPASVGRSRRTVAALVAAVALAAVAGCGSSRDYTVPDSLCGVPVHSADLAPLLPDGGTLKQDRYPSEPGAPRCTVLVDDSQVMRFSGDFAEPETDPFKVNEAGLLDQGHPEQVEHVGKRATLTDHGALAVTDCTHQGKRKQYVVELDLATDTPGKTADRRSAALTLFRSYFAHAAQKQGCR